MIPSQECLTTLGDWIPMMRARCWCQCCGWRRRRTDWIDPEVALPQHQEKHRPFNPEAIEEVPKGWGTMSRDCKEALSSVIVTSSDCSEPIPAAACSTASGVR
ncbi:hypothetical protein WJX74_004362 [Apatococcus lobatus]|uniref:Uncharacterized protein n=1 Tax=Apatococcus lobatus TaxID=904363 RepID=A0AAW1SE90_9CHLO